MNIELKQISSIVSLDKVEAASKPSAEKIKAGIGSFIEGQVMTIASAKEAGLKDMKEVKQEFKLLIDTVKDPKTEFVLYNPNTSSDRQSVFLHNDLLDGSAIGAISQPFLTDSVKKIWLNKEEVRKVVDSDQLTNYLGRLRDEILIDDFKYSGSDFTNRFRSQMAQLGYRDQE